MYGLTMAGRNGHVKTGRNTSSQKTIRTVDVERAQAAKEAELRGTPELRAALHPGGLFRLRSAVSVQGQAGSYDELGPCAGGSTHPRHLSAGAIMMMIRVERVDVKTNAGTLRKPYYTFLIMGHSKRCVLKTLSLIEPC